MTSTVLDSAPRLHPTLLWGLAPFFQRLKMTLEDIKWQVLDPTALKWLSCNFESGPLTPHPKPLIYSLSQTLQAKGWGGGGRGGTKPTSSMAGDKAPRM